MRSGVSLANALCLVLLGTLACPRICSSADQTESAQSDVQQKVKAYEASCVGNLRTVNVAQATYWRGDPKKGYARNLRDLGPNGEGVIVDSRATAGENSHRV